MKIFGVFSLLFVLVSLSLASLATAEHLTRDAAASSITDRDEAKSSSVAADTDEPARSGGYWAAWAEAAAH
jgi:hypothetical protein